MEQERKPLTLQEVVRHFNRNGIKRKLDAKLTYILNKPCKLTIGINTGSYANEHLINIGLDERYAGLSLKEFMIVVDALLGHEAQHKLSSNFKRFGEYIDRVSAKLISQGVSKRFAESFVHSIGNIIEDGRIERILGRKLPGFIPKLQLMNLYEWKNYTMTGEDSNISAFTNTLLMQSKLGLYPKGYKDHYPGTELDDVFQSILPLVPKGIIARTHADSLEVCEEIVDKITPWLLKEYEEVKQEEEMMEKLMELLNEIQQSSQYTESEESQKNEGGSGGNSSPIHIQLSPKPNSKKEKGAGGKGKGGEEEDSEESESGSGSGSGKKSDKETNEENSEGSASGDGEEKTDEGAEKKNGPGKKSEELTSAKEGEDGGEKDGNKNSDGSESKESSDAKEPGNKTMPNVNNIHQSSGREETPEDLGERDENAIDEMIRNIEEGLEEEVERNLTDANKIEQAENSLKIEEEPTVNPNSLNLRCDFREYPMTGEPHYVVPNNIKVMAKSFRREVERILKGRNKLDVHGQKKGVLNEDDLYRIGLEDYNVFTVEGQKSLSDHVFYILQDGSGSMSGTKEENSAYALGVIEEGLKGLIPFKMTTFTAGYNQIIHHVVKPWTGKSKKNYAYSFYRRKRASGGNEDDVSIEIATAELMRRSERDKVLIVLSDGLPSSTNRTREAIKEARKKGIHVVGIMFGDSEFRAQNYETYKDMYETNIISCSTNMIPQKLVSVLTKILKR